MCINGEHIWYRIGWCLKEEQGSCRENDVALEKAEMISGWFDCVL